MTGDMGAESFRRMAKTFADFGDTFLYGVRSMAATFEATDATGVRRVYLRAKAELLWTVRNVRRFIREAKFEWREIFQ